MRADNEYAGREVAPLRVLRRTAPPVAPQMIPTGDDDPATSLGHDGITGELPHAVATALVDLPQLVTGDRVPLDRRVAEQHAKVSARGEPGVDLPGGVEDVRIHWRRQREQRTLCIVLPDQAHGIGRHALAPNVPIGDTLIEL